MGCSNTLIHCAILALIGIVSTPICASASEADLKWHQDLATNCWTTDSSSYNDAARAFSESILRRYDEITGCVTTPYLAPNYDADCRLRVCSDVHAGVDLRSKEVPPATVHSFTTGKVLSVNPDGSKSTLVILSSDKTHKIFYLHMSEIHARQGQIVNVGDDLGVTGDVNTSHRHLHVEVWPNTSPIFSTRHRAIIGQFCATGVCTAAEIRSYTVDPIAYFRSMGRGGGVAEGRKTPESHVVDVPTDAEKIALITKFYNSSEECADYFVLKGVELSRRPIPRTNYVVAKLELTLAPPHEQSVLGAPFKFGMCTTYAHVSRRDVGTTKHLVAGFQFKSGRTGWEVERMEENPAIYSACMCPWLFWEDRLRRCGGCGGSF